VSAETTPGAKQPRALKNCHIQSIGRSSLPFKPDHSCLSHGSSKPSVLQHPVAKLTAAASERAHWQVLTLTQSHPVTSNLPVQRQISHTSTVSQPLESLCHERLTPSSLLPIARRMGMVWLRFHWQGIGQFGETTVIQFFILVLVLVFN
jgi:hypothetical protein